MSEAESQLVIEIETCREGAGIQLRGCCAGPTEAEELKRSIRQAVATQVPILWVNCFLLESLSWHGQRAILEVQNEARRARIRLYWCGFSAAVLEQMGRTGLQLLLHTLPASSYPSNNLWA